MLPIRDTKHLSLYTALSGVRPDPTGSTLTQAFEALIQQHVFRGLT